MLEVNNIYQGNCLALMKDIMEISPEYVDIIKERLT